MISKVKNYIEKHHMIEAGDTVITGVSGGADSVCLFFMLLEIKMTLPFRIVVVHVNHGIREEAIAEADFVKQLCAEHEITFFLVEENISTISKEKHISIEEAGRHVRYLAFENAAKKYTNAKIAVAHNKNDRAETMLFHLFRGSGLKGLVGIAPKRDQVIRPLLCLEREEIEQYLKDRKQTFCTDMTNYADDYTRNKIRNHIVSYAEKEICKGSISHMNETADILQEMELFIRQLSKKECDALIERENESIIIPEAPFLKHPLFLQKQILLYCFEMLMIYRRDITHVHVEQVLHLFGGQVGREVHLPYHIVAKKTYDKVIIAKGAGKENKEESKKTNIGRESFSISLDFISACNKEYIVEHATLGQVGFTVFPMQKSKIIPQKTYTKWFDYDKIVESLTIRTREVKDIICIDDELHTQSMKSYMINTKIPREKRNDIFLLACKNDILWVVGHRISNQYKITEHTKRILQVRIIGGNESG